jgi:hypothetical protein
MALPSITIGIIIGTAAITGLPVIMKAVTGVMILRIMPHHSPAVRTAMIMQALMIGPVINTLKFLKNWLTIQMASKIPVSAICFVVIFIALFLPWM